MVILSLFIEKLTNYIVEALSDPGSLRSVAVMIAGNSVFFLSMRVI